MKKTQLWAVILPLFILFFASCSDTENRQPNTTIPFGPGVSNDVEVSCEYPMPVLSSRFDCKGKRLLEPKVTGWDSEICRKMNRVYFTDSLLNSAGYYFNKLMINSPSMPICNPAPVDHNNSSILNFLNNFPWEWLFGLIILAILILTLISLIRDFLEKNTTPATTTSSTKTSSTASDYKSEAELLERVMAGMSNCNVTDVAVEFPNGPRIRMKGNGNKKESGVINLKKEKKPAQGKPTDQSSEKKQ